MFFEWSTFRKGMGKATLFHSQLESLGSIMSSPNWAKVGATSVFT